MSRPITRSFLPSLTLVLAGPFLHIGAAAAGNSVDELLQQQRVLLAGRTVTVSASAREGHSAPALRSTGDAQELARRLLLAVPARTPAQRLAAGNRIYGDAQLLARHVVLGRSGAPAAGS